MPNHSPRSGSRDGGRLPVYNWTGGPHWFEGSDAREPITSALDEVQEEVDHLRSYGATEAADAAEAALDRVAEIIRDGLDEPLTVQEAAEASGYSADRLRGLIRQGTIPNAGKKNAPRVRRRDLPRQPGHGPARASEKPAPVGSRRRMARSVVESE